MDGQEESDEEQLMWWQQTGISELQIKEIMNYEYSNYGIGRIRNGEKYQHEKSTASGNATDSGAKKAPAVPF